MIFFTKKRTAVFQGATLCEAAGNVPNPGRGWYHIYTYILGSGENCELPPAFYEGETLALVLIDIGAYREQPLEEESLNMIHRILECFAASGRDIILRIVYDTQGKGMEHEPSLFSQVEQHMEQLTPLLLRHSDHILVFQGLLVGSWGEMHTSKFVSEKYLWKLSQCFLSGTKGKVRLAVRKPVQCRIVQPENAVGETLTGCFDDAIFASETHMGTFGAQDRQSAGWKQPWCPAEEIQFLEKLSGKVPFGGEALSGVTGMIPADTIKRLRALHVSYLNCVHEEARLREWRETEYAAGVSLYDQIGAWLGYRFVAEAVSLEKKGKETCVRLKIANRGFACCTEEVQFLLYVQSQEESVISAGNEQIDVEGISSSTSPQRCKIDAPLSAAELLASVDCSLGKLAAGESVTFRIPLEDGKPSGGEALYGELRRVRDQRIIRFANEPVGDRLLLGIFN